MPSRCWPTIWNARWWICGWRKPAGRAADHPALVGQDMRGLRRLLEAGFGWTVLPLYLCGDALERGKLAEIPAPVGPVVMQYHLVWAAGAAPAARGACPRSAVARAEEVAWRAKRRIGRAGALWPRWRRGWWWRWRCGWRWPIIRCGLMNGPR
jgi:DNA-binding transcriptional LysR family regulator